MFFEQPGNSRWWWILGFPGIDTYRFFTLTVHKGGEKFLNLHSNFLLLHSVSQKFWCILHHIIEGNTFKSCQYYSPCIILLVHK